jgi:hypothetical protein
MSEPTPPHGSGPDRREETRAFAAPVPPQQPTDVGPAAPTATATAGAGTRRGTLVMGAAAVGLLAVGVAVGVVVGQATAGSAAADTGSVTTQTVPGDGSGGTPPDGGWQHDGGRGDFAPPDGTTGGGDATT